MPRYLPKQGIILLCLVLLCSCSAQSTTPPDAPSPSDLPFTGTLTLDEYDWFGVNPYLGVIELELPTGKKTRILDGNFPTRYPDGRILFRQGCGQYVSRLALRDKEGLITVVSPCSSELDNPTPSPSDFGFSKLSPDGQKIAAELHYFLLDISGRVYQTIVFDLEGNQLALFDNVYAPEWLPDGRLLLSGEGFYVTDTNLENPTRLGDQLNTFVNNPAVDPSGTRIAFEYNQQIWLMNLDGSDLQEAVFGGKRLRYPVWSPDGKTLAYLALEADDRYDKAIYFTDLTAGKSYVLDLSLILDSISTSIVPNGPLSWTE